MTPLRQKIARFLLGEAERAALARGEAAAAQNEEQTVRGAAADTNSSEEEGFEARLARFIEALDDGTRLLTAGKIQAVNLQPLRERLGSGWERVAQRIHAVARTTIERHLGYSDVFSRHGDDAYVILFAQLGRDEAAFKAACIAREIEERLFGEIPDASVTVRSLVVHVDGGIEFAEAAPEALVERLIDRAGRAFRRAARPAGPPVASLPPPARLLFSPIWFVPQNMLSAYRCLPHYDRSGGFSFADQDLGVVRAVIFELQRMATSGQTAVLVVPIRLAALNSTAKLERLIQACRDIPQASRRLIVFELTDIPPDVAQTRLSGVLMRLKPFCRAMVCRVGFDFLRVERIDRALVHSIGAEAVPEGADEAALFARIERLANLAPRHGLRSFVYGMQTRSLITKAVAAGIDYVAGDPVGRASPQIEGVHRFDISSLYGALARA